MVINQAAARALMPGKESAINRVVRIHTPAFAGLEASSKEAVVVGVAANMKPPGRGSEAPAAVYSSMYEKGVADFNPKLILNGTISREAIEAALGKHVEAKLPGMTILSVHRLSDRLNRAFASQSTGTYLATGGALLMTAVSCVGLYASLAYLMRSRRRELAIRSCLGATSGDIRKIVYYRALTISGLGVLVSAIFWPVLAQLSSVDFLGAASWSTGRAVKISVASLCVAVAIGRLAARDESPLSPSRLLKED